MTYRRKYRAFLGKKIHGRFCGLMGLILKRIMEKSCLEMIQEALSREHRLLKMQLIQFLCLGYSGVVVVVVLTESPSIFFYHRLSH